MRSLYSQGLDSLTPAQPALQPSKRAQENTDTIGLFVAAIPALVNLVAQGVEAGGREYSSRQAEQAAQREKSASAQKYRAEHADEIQQAAAATSLLKKAATLRAQAIDAQVSALSEADPHGPLHKAAAHAQQLADLMEKSASAASAKVAAVAPAQAPAPAPPAPPPSKKFVVPRWVWYAGGGLAGFAAIALVVNLVAGKKKE